MRLVGDPAPGAAPCAGPGAEKPRERALLARPLNMIKKQTEGTSVCVCQIQRVRQGQAGERGVKSVARKGQGGGRKGGPALVLAQLLKGATAGQALLSRGSLWLQLTHGTSRSDSGLTRGHLPGGGLPSAPLQASPPHTRPAQTLPPSLSLPRLHSTDDAKQPLGPQSSPWGHTAPRTALCPCPLRADGKNTGLG